jgi:hypothetical protein
LSERVYCLSDAFENASASDKTEKIALVAFLYIVRYIWGRIIYTTR